MWQEKEVTAEGGHRADDGGMWSQTGKLIEPWKLGVAEEEPGSGASLLTFSEHREREHGSVAEAAHTVRAARR